MTHSTALHTRLLELLPRAAHKPVCELLDTFPITLKISRSRSSKWGDYRYGMPGKAPAVSVNGDLHPSLFLLTLIHELAHHEVAVNYGRKVRPHGVEWQQAFRQLLAPFLEDDSFPPPVRQELVRHMQRPKATVSADPKLYAALMDLQGRSGEFIHELSSGDRFEFKERIYQMQGKRRTRFLCKDVANGRQYLFRSATPVRKTS